MVLTLPMAGFIKKYFPRCRIVFLGRSYTKDVVFLSEHVDEFMNWEDLKDLSLEKQREEFKKIAADVIVHVFPVKEIAVLAKRSGIRLRAGTTNRFYHWFTCNKLIPLSRKNSPLHESQLNLRLLRFLNAEVAPELPEVSSLYGFTRVPPLEDAFKNLVDKSKFNVILHPKSKGSAREWGLNNFSLLMDLLPKEKYNVFVSGTEQEGKMMQEFLKANPDAVSLCGKLSLKQFIAFINECDALVAASTGPVHIAAALEKKAIALFSSKRPIHPGRWKPVGKRAYYLVHDENCAECSAGKECRCIEKISPQQIVDLLQKND